MPNLLLPPSPQENLASMAQTPLNVFTPIWESQLPHLTVSDSNEQVGGGGAASPPLGPTVSLHHQQGLRLIWPFILHWLRDHQGKTFV